jgi:hypothetical protein
VTRDRKKVKGTGKWQINYLTTNIYDQYIEKFAALQQIHQIGTADLGPQFSKSKIPSFQSIVSEANEVPYYKKPLEISIRLKTTGFCVTIFTLK